MRIRNRGVRAVVVAVIALGALIPESALAQDAASTDEIERIPNEGEVTSEGADTNETDALPEPERFELSAGLTLPLVGTAGLLNAQPLDALRLGGDIGFPLGSRALITVGVRAGITVTEGTYVMVSVPVTALVYLDEPRAGALVPTIRVGIGATLYDYTGSEGGLGGLSYYGNFGMNVVARGGLTWFIVEAVGIRAEVGVNADMSFWTGYTAFGVGMDAAASMVMRI